MAKVFILDTCGYKVCTLAGKYNLSYKYHCGIGEERKSFFISVLCVWFLAQYQETSSFVLWGCQLPSEPCNGRKTQDSNCHQSLLSIPQLIMPMVHDISHSLIPKLLPIILVT